MKYNPEEIIKKSQRIAEECEMSGMSYQSVMISALGCQIRELCDVLNDVDKTKADRVLFNKYNKGLKKAYDATVKEGE